MRRCSSVGRDKDVLIVSVDGGCPGVHNVKDGVIGATSMQFPLLMAAKGVEAVKKFAKTGSKPQPSPGLDFFNTGVELDDRQAGRGPDLDRQRRRLEEVLGLSEARGSIKDRRRATSRRLSSKQCPRRPPGGQCCGSRKAR